MEKKDSDKLGAEVPAAALAGRAGGLSPSAILYAYAVEGREKRGLTPAMVAEIDRAYTALREMEAYAAVAREVEASLGALATTVDAKLVAMTPEQLDAARGIQRLAPAPPGPWEPVPAGTALIPVPTLLLHGQAYVQCNGSIGPDGRCQTCGTSVTATGGAHMRLV